MRNNKNLQKARNVKNDEFYTQYEDIEKELIHYKEQFRGKIVYCNCDNPNSNFVKFFENVKSEWDIKEFWHTSIDEGVSFDSDYAKELLNKCDIVVTNPPFSIVRERFLPMLIESGKQFLFIENLNLATMRDVFPLIKDNKLWTGYTHPKQFIQPDNTYKKFGNILWYTNMQVDKHIEINPDKNFDLDKYPLYDNYNAFNIDKLSDIPYNFETIATDEQIQTLKDRGIEFETIEDNPNKIRLINPVIGVPVTFIEKHNPCGNGGAREEFTSAQNYQLPKRK